MNRTLTLAAIALALASPAHGQSTRPAAPLMQPATASPRPGAAAPAKPALPQGGRRIEDHVDDGAKAIYDAGCAAVAALDAVAFIAEYSIEGVDAMSFEVTWDFEVPGKPGEPKLQPTRVRISKLESDKPASTVMCDGARSSRIDFGARTYVNAGSDWGGFDGGEPQAIPSWMLRQHMLSRASTEMRASMPKLVGASMGDVETLDGHACDVVRIVRSFEIEVVEDEPADGEKPTLVMRTIREIEEIAFSQKDHLPRRITQSAESNMDMLMPPQTVAMTRVRANPSLAADHFTLSPPEGFTEIATPDSGGPRLGVQAGDAAHEFSLTDLSGASVTLGSLKGKVVLLDFWATWCGPCKAAMPMLQKLSTEYAAKPVAVLGINTWEKTEGAAKRFMELKAYTYGCLLNGDDLAKSYGIPGLPTVIIVGKDGRVAFAEVGLADASGDALRRVIDAELAK